jgi:membrane fusion protein, multidrug efflux system
MDALAKWNAATAKQTKVRFTFKQLVLLCLACVFCLAAAGYGYYWWAVDRFFQSTDDAYVGGDVTPISPHIAGFIAEVAVKDNELVHAGQLLVRLDDRDTRAAADHAQAVLEQRGATLTSLQAKYELQQSTIKQANADVDAKTAQAGFAKVDASATTRSPSPITVLGRMPSAPLRSTRRQGPPSARRKLLLPRQNSN